MKNRSIIGLMGAIIIAALPAYAFQEQHVGGAESAAPAQSGGLVPDAQKGDSNSAPADMQLSPAERPKSTEGTEVRIPGLGTLGVLPKMDFGLEMLYGADTGKPGDEPAATQSTDDGLEIRGTVKHKF